MKRASHSIVAAALAGPLALGFAATPAAAADAASLCAGVAEDGRTLEKEFPHSLRLVYAEPGGAYLGDIATEIAKDGEVLVSERCPGPWLLADLPSGSYDVKATFEGETKSFQVSVGGEGVTEKTVTF